MSADEAEVVKEAMAALRAAAESQLGVSELASLDAGDADHPDLVDGLPERYEEPDRASLVKRVEELEPWLQGPFPLGGGLLIKGAWRNDTRWQGLAAHVPDVRGKRVLDVGSNAGYDPFRFKRLGAAEVIACEPFDFFRQMEFLESIYNSGITPTRLAWQGLDPAELGRFDLVHCHGVLYHDLHPVALLQRLREMLADDGTLLFGSMMLESVEHSEYARFVPGAYYGDTTWWWVPGRLAMRWMLESVGFAVEEEFGVSPGPPGEFATVNGYFRARRGEPDAAVTWPWPRAG